MFKLIFKSNNIQGIKISLSLLLALIMWVGLLPSTAMAGQSPASGVYKMTLSDTSPDRIHNNPSNNSLGVATIGDTYTFTLIFENTSPTHDDLSNIILTERDYVFANRVTFVPGSVKVNGVSTTDDIDPSTGYLPFTLPSTPLPYGQSITVTYDAVAHTDGALHRHISGVYSAPGTIANGILSYIILTFYDVVYHANNGTPTTYTVLPRTDIGTAHDILQNTDANLGFTDPTGKDFLGWSTSPSGGTLDYPVGSASNIGRLVPTNTTLDLYAVWGTLGVATYTTSYDANTGTGTVPTDSSTYIPGALVTVLSGSQLSKTGYTFNGWNTAANGSGTSYSTGATFNITANTTLYAQWTANSSGGGGGGGGTTPTTEAPPTTSTSTEVLPATTEDLSATTEVDIPDFDDSTEETDSSTSDQIAKPTKNNKPPKATTPPRFNGNSRTPTTGDVSNYMLHITVLLASVITLIVAYERRKKI